MSEPLYSWDRRTIEELKSNPDIEAVKTFRVNREAYPYRMVLMKEKESAYEKEFSRFVELLKRCNFRKHLIKNPFYQNVLTDEYWIRQEELRKDLRKRWFDITQHIIYNKTATVNPNLPKGSVYSSGDWGKRIVKLEKHFRFIK